MTVDTKIINISLANPRGFCAGVDRAIQIVKLALKKYGAPIYVRHEVVHNKYVIEELRNEGAIFVDEIKQIPSGSHVIFSAHGVSKLVTQQSRDHNLIPIDATCPLVTKVHKEVNKMLSDHDLIIIVGSTNSSNSNRLVDIAKENNVKSFLIDNMDMFDPACLQNKKKVGISAGASAPEVLVQQLIKKIKQYTEVNLVELDGVEEKVTFKLPAF